VATLPELQAQLEALRANRAAGIRSFDYGGRKLEYRTDAEISSAIDDIERRIARERASATGGKIVRQVLMRQSGRGY
jgi:hypothetical protein